MPKRRRGLPLAPTRPRASRHQRFDRLVDRAVAGIPQPFRAALDEIAIVIADEPSPEQLRENGLEPDETLYGLYEGVPLDEWGADWARCPSADPRVPAAARGGLPRPRRPRRRGPDHDPPRARAPPGHRRRGSPGGARDRLGPAGCGQREASTPPTIARSAISATSASPGVTHGAHRSPPVDGLPPGRPPARACSA